MSGENSFSEAMKWISTNPWLSILSLVLGALGVTLAIIFYLKSRKFKLPCYALQSFNIVRDLSSKIESLEMFFSNDRIYNLTVSKLAFWNAGRDTINSNDVATSDPITVKISDDNKILDVKIIYTKNAANNFTISLSNNQSYFNIDFEYIDKGEGAVIQFFHTGKKINDIQVSGIIKGGGKLIPKFIQKQQIFFFPFKIHLALPRRKRKLLLAFITFTLPILYTIYALFISATRKDEIVYKIVSIIMIFLMYYALGFSMIIKKVPKGFDSFESTFE